MLSFDERLVSGPFEARTEWLAGITHACLPIRSLGQLGNEQPDLPIHALLSCVARVEVSFLVISSLALYFREAGRTGATALGNSNAIADAEKSWAIAHYMGDNYASVAAASVGIATLAPSELALAFKARWRSCWTVLAKPP